MPLQFCAAHAASCVHFPSNANTTALALACCRRAENGATDALAAPSLPVKGAPSAFDALRRVKNKVSARYAAP